MMTFTGQNRRPPCALLSVAAMSAAFFVLAACQAAPVAQPPPCERAETRAQAVIKFTPYAYEMERLTGVDAQSYIMAYNAVPPETDVEVDEVIVIATPFQPDRVYIIMVLKGCVVLSGEAKNENHERLKAGPRPAGLAI